MQIDETQHRTGRWRLPWGVVVFLSFDLDGRCTFARVETNPVRMWREAIRVGGDEIHACTATNEGRATKLRFFSRDGAQLALLRSRVSSHPSFGLVNQFTELNVTGHGSRTKEHTAELRDIASALCRENPCLHVSSQGTHWLPALQLGDIAKQWDAMGRPSFYGLRWSNLSPHPDDPERVFIDFEPGLPGNRYADISDDDVAPLRERSASIVSTLFQTKGYGSRGFTAEPPRREITADLRRWHDSSADLLDHGIDEALRALTSEASQEDDPRERITQPRSPRLTKSPGEFRKGDEVRGHRLPSGPETRPLPHAYFENEESASPAASPPGDPSGEEETLKSIRRALRSGAVDSELLATIEELRAQRPNRAEILILSMRAFIEAGETDDARDVLDLLRSDEVEDLASYELVEMLAAFARHLDEVGDQADALRAWLEYGLARPLDNQTFGRVVSLINPESDTSACDSEAQAQVSAYLRKRVQATIERGLPDANVDATRPELSELPPDGLFPALLMIAFDTVDEPSARTERMASIGERNVFPPEWLEQATKLADQFRSRRTPGGGVEAVRRAQPASDDGGRSEERTTREIPRETAEVFERRITAKVENGELDDALSELSGRLRESGDSRERARLLMRKAQLQQERGDDPKQVAFTLTGVQILDPHNIDAHVQMVTLHLHASQRSQAREAALSLLHSIIEAHDPFDYAERGITGLLRTVGFESARMLPSSVQRELEEHHPNLLDQLGR